ncbi:hypothetical protein EI94DRAFT_1703401 [Lactarius quietus]|nr:hypothetical protein EI94DRAFT_1703401 [Lactarius quietus]
MSPLGDYMEFDHADNIDDSGVPAHSDRSVPGHAHNAYPTDGSVTNAEDIPLCLPLSLGWDWCLHRGHRSLAIKEAKLCFAQAGDALHRIRLALRFKSVLFQTQLPLLKLADLPINTIVLGAVPTRQRNQQLSWIWSFGTATRQDGAWMDDFNRVHWLHAKAQFERWKEEEVSIHNEAVWIPAFFTHRQSVGALR